MKSFYSQRSNYLRGKRSIDVNNSRGGVSLAVHDAGGARYLFLTPDDARAMAVSLIEEAARAEKRLRVA